METAEGSAGEDTVRSASPKREAVGLKRKVKRGLGIDVEASVKDFMRRNKGVMERLKNL
jgi:hypothetical protein